MKVLTQYWVILVETFDVHKFGPYFSEKEVDEEAKKIFQEIKKQNIKRAQSIRSMLLLELTNNNQFQVSIYEPEFLLEGN